MKILMVCLGNICRSPIAEGTMKSRLHQIGIDSVVDSAGILSYHAGDAPDSRAVKIAARYKVDISTQIARKIKISDFDEFDFIFAMDQSVFNSLNSLTKNSTQFKKLHLFLEYAGFNPGAEVPDPYYGEMDGFDQVYKLVDDACQKIIKKWYPEL